MAEPTSETCDCVAFHYFAIFLNLTTEQGKSCFRNRLMVLDNGSSWSFSNICIVLSIGGSMQYSIIILKIGRRTCGEKIDK